MKDYTNMDDIVTDDPNFQVILYVGISVALLFLLIIILMTVIAAVIMIKKKQGY